MPSISFRHRILLALLLLGAVPSSILIAGWARTLLRNNPARASQLALEPVRLSGRALLGVLDTTRLAPAELAALRNHTDALNEALRSSQRALVIGRYQTIALTITVVGLGLGLIYLSVLLGRSLSRQLSSPIDQLIGWTRHIRRQEPLPVEEARRGSPEFAALRTALREMAASLQQARAAELESERLRAFREVARRVAHEMKNPLTPVRFAVSQLARDARPEQQEALEVLRTETARLDLLAKDFANLGRLPEGPAAEVDLGELLGELLRTSLPEGMTYTLEVAPGTPNVVGHYDPLRRGFGNLIRNAVEACRGRGVLNVGVTPEPGGVRVAIADHGPGVSPEKRARIFEPYFTDKAEGTGLGLAIAKQAVDLHAGSIEVTDTAAGGATFVVWLPEGPSNLPPAPADPGGGTFDERRVADRRGRNR